MQQIKEKLIKFFNCNKHNNKLIQIISNPQIIISVYKSLEKNKNAITSRTNIVEIKNLSNQLKKGRYIWQKNALSIKNKIFLKLIKLVLIVIYQPIFQKLNYNFGFKINTNIQCLNVPILYTKLWALKGEIINIKLDIIDKRTMIRILKKKIADSNFLALIKIMLKNTKQLLAYSIYYLLLNIYLYEFDLFILKKIKKINLLNLINNTNLIIKNKKLHLSYAFFKLKATQKILLAKIEKTKLNVKKFQSVKNRLKKIFKANNI